MKKFSDFIIESKFNQSTLDKFEKAILKLDPKKFIKKAEEAANSSNYWYKRPNFEKWSDQNGYNGNSYTVGSDYDLFRNYNWYRTSDKIKKHIEKGLPIKKVPFHFDKSWNFEQDGEFHVFRVKSKTDEIPKLLIDKNGFLSRNKILKYIEHIVEMQIDDKGVFSFNKYRNRKGVTPSDAISKKDLIKEVEQAVISIHNEQNELRDLKESMLLVLSDEVIGSEFVYDNREIVAEMKKQLKEAKTVKQYKEVLNKFNFTNIPSDDILEEMMKSKDFYYSTDRPDGYGHQTGTEYRINFEKRVIISNGWSSDD